MCYETYERLLKARAARRAAERPATPEREAPKPEAHEASIGHATPEPAQVREKEPA